MADTEKKKKTEYVTVSEVKFDGKVYPAGKKIPLSDEQAAAIPWAVKAIE